MKPLYKPIIRRLEKEQTKNQLDFTNEKAMFSLTRKKQCLDASNILYDNKNYRMAAQSACECIEHTCNSILHATPQTESISKKEKKNAIYHHNIFNKVNCIHTSGQNIMSYDEHINLTELPKYNDIRLKEIQDEEKVATEYNKIAKELYKRTDNLIKESKKEEMAERIHKDFEEFESGKGRL